MHIENHHSTRHILLGITVSLCVLLSSCSTFKKFTKTETHLSEYEQISPVKGKVISAFGYRGTRRHTGSDIKLQHGDTIKAAFCGRVTRASDYSGYGNLVILKHANNIITYYAHLSKCLVEVGDSVVAGDVVGLGGRTGRASTDHLHFEVRYNNSPRNPEEFFDFASGTVRIPFLAYSPAKESKKADSKDYEKTTNFESVVTIKPGDTLYALARRHNTTVKQLQELNNLEEPTLMSGMKLKVK